MALGSKSTVPIRTAVDSILREFCKYDEDRERWFQEKQRLERDIVSYKKELETKDKEYEILLKRYRILELSIKNNKSPNNPESNGQDIFDGNYNAMKTGAIKIKLKSKKKNQNLWSRTLPTSLSPQKLLGFIDDFSGKFNQNIINNNNQQIGNNNLGMIGRLKDDMNKDRNNEKKDEDNKSMQQQKRGQNQYEKKEERNDDVTKKSNTSMTTKSTTNNVNAFKLQLSPSITLRHHLDSVRSLCLNDDETVLISGSDDGTIKLWDLNKISSQVTLGGMGGGNNDRSPIPITFRGHLASVNCCCMIPNTSTLITGSFDTNIYGWKLPLNGTILMEMESLATLRQFEMKQHSDIIWDIVSHYSQPLIASISADNTCKIYNLNQEELALNYRFNDKLINNKYIGQTSLKWNNYSGDEKLCISTISGHVILFDIEKQRIISDVCDSKYNYCINRIYSDDGILNNSSLIYSACDDSRVRLFDIKSNKCIISQKVHTDSVTSMVVHSSSSSILTSSHDCRLRVWDFKINKFSCVQDLEPQDTHPAKWEQGILCMAFDNNHKWLFSGGADGIRLYQTNL